MKYYLGVDGGGTKTTVAVTDENGKLLLKKSGKTINFYSVGMETSRKNLKNLMEEIYKCTGFIKFDGVFIGCSALDNEADEEVTDKLCKDIISAEKIIMHSDVYIALKSLGDEICPAVVICGTGSMAAGEDEYGNTQIAGGWGHILGDEGSAYSIAISAIKKCTILSDEGKNALLIDELKEHFDVKSVRDVIDIIYSHNTTKDMIASFAERVGKLAKKGDIFARSIILQEAETISKMTTILLDRIKHCKVLGLYGGVFQHNELFRTAFTIEIKKSYPDLEIKLLTIPPEEIAAHLARTIA